MIEVILAVMAVIGLLWEGIYIGREYGTFEKFVILILEKFKGMLS